jgi:L-arabinonolactonase
MRQFVARPIYRPPSEGLRFLPECPRMLRNLPGGAPLVGWVGIQHGAGSCMGSINLLNLASRQNTSFPLPGRPGFFVETEQPGMLLIGLERRLVLFDLLARRLIETGVRLPEDERVIINDGIAIAGGLLFGTKDLQFRERIAGLYRFDAESRSLTQLVAGEICSNGKHLVRDADGAVLIEIDSLPRTITRYRLDAGLRRVLEQSLVVEPALLPAIPDGLRATPDGAGIVVAYYNPEAVSMGLAQEIRLADGAVLTEWLFPGSPRVTCPEFAWIDGRVQLIFTTATEGMAREIRDIAPEAGTMFCAETHFQTMPEPPPLLAMWRNPIGPPGTGKRLNTDERG